MNEVMTLPEVAEYLRVSRRTLYRLLEHPNQIPAFKIGRQWRFNREYIDRWRLAQKQYDA